MRLLTRPSEPAKILFAYGTLSARLVPLWIAEEQGFFKKYGVPAGLVFVRGASTLMAALASPAAERRSSAGHSDRHIRRRLKME